MTKKKLISIMICFVVLFMTGAYYFVSANQDKSVLSGQTTQIATLKNQVAVLKAATNNSDASAKAAQAGLDMDRVKKDEAMFTDFMSNTVLNFNSVDSYTSVRSRLKEQYKMSDADAFLVAVLPSDNWPDGVSVSNGVSAGVSFTDPTYYVTGISGDSYSYLVAGTLKRGDAAQSVAMRFTVKASKDITALSAVEL